MNLSSRLKCNLHVGFVNLFTNDFKGTKLPIRYKEDNFSILANPFCFVIKMIYHKVQIACKYSLLTYLFAESHKSMPRPNNHALPAS